MWQFLIPAAATLIGAKISGDAAKSAARTSAASADKATELQKQMYEEGVARQQPFLAGGTEDYNRLRALTSGGPGAAQQFLTMDPGYGFRLSEGMKALERGAAARGGLMSGATGKALQRYGQDMASQEFGNAYNRLAGLAAIGPSAAGVTNALGQTYAGNVGNIMMGQGQIAANAMLSRGSAYQRGFSDIGRLAGRYYGQPGGTGYMAPVEDRSIYSAPGFEAGMDDYYSDARLKTNVRKLGTRADGLGVYEFNYVWGGPKQIGLMAQEVQPLYPDAVTERGGYLMVNYGKV